MSDHRKLGAFELAYEVAVFGLKESKLTGYRRNNLSGKLILSLDYKR